MILRKYIHLSNNVSDQVVFIRTDELGFKIFPWLGSDLRYFLG